MREEGVVVGLNSPKEMNTVKAKRSSFFMGYYSDSCCSGIRTVCQSVNAGTETIFLTP